MEEKKNGEKKKVKKFCEESRNIQRHKRCMQSNVYLFELNSPHVETVYLYVVSWEGAHYRHVGPKRKKKKKKRHKHEHASEIGFLMGRIHLSNIIWEDFVFIIIFFFFLS